MKRLRLVILVVLACSLTGQAQQPARGPGNPLLAIVQSELQRNFEGLKKEPVPPYFISYTLHDMRTTRMSAAFGALQRSDEAATASRRSRCASATTRSTTRTAARRRRRLASPHQRRLPAADRRAEADPPGTVAGDDRSFKQAAEALTRVKTNVAAKIKDGTRRPTFRASSRRPTPARRPPTGGHQGRGKRVCAGSRRSSAAIRSSSTATSRSRSNRTTAITPTARARRSSPAS